MILTAALWSRITTAPRAIMPCCCSTATREAVIYPDLFYEVPEYNEEGKLIGTYQQLIGVI